jgi:hypothetical protein
VHAAALTSFRIPLLHTEYNRYGCMKRAHVLQSFHAGPNMRSGQGMQIKVNTHTSVLLSVRQLRHGPMNYHSLGYPHDSLGEGLLHQLFA